jgi:hypothetical protein
MILHIQSKLDFGKAIFAQWNTLQVFWPILIETVSF